MDGMCAPVCLAIKCKLCTYSDHRVSKIQVLFFEDVIKQYTRYTNA